MICKYYSMEKLVFIAAIAVYTILFALYFFAFNQSGKGMIYIRNVVLSIAIFGSMALGYFAAVFFQTGDKSYLWGIIIFCIGLSHAVWKFVRTG